MMPLNFIIFLYPGCIWILPSILSFMPIFLGVYTTDDYRERAAKNSELCEFVPNTGKLIEIPTIINQSGIYSQYTPATRISMNDTSLESP